MSEFPLSWVAAALHEVVPDPQQDIVDGPFGSNLKTSEYRDSGIPIIRLQNVARNHFLEKNIQFITHDKADELQRHNFIAGDIAITKLGEPLGKAAIIPPSLSRGVIVADIVRLRVDREFADPRYLTYVINSPDVCDALAEETKGTTRPRVNLGHIRALQVPIAPLNEQKRIADKLDLVLARVDACRERLDRVPAILKRFRQAVLAAAISGKLTEEWRTGNTPGATGQSLLETVRARHRAYSVSGLAKRAGGVQGNAKKILEAKASKVPEPVEDTELGELPVGWTWGAGAEVVEPGAEIVYGIVQPGPKLTEGVSYVRGMDIENGKILKGQLLKTSPTIAARYSRSSLEGGDVLLGIIRATKVAIVPASLKGANITQGTARFRPSPAVRTRYLAIALEAPSTQHWLHDHYRGIDMPGLNLADVRRVPIPLPSLPEQDEIVRRVDALLSRADRLEARYTAARAQVERLTPALLAKAFRGELVPQDPNDEPASVLLERIRATRAAAGEKPPRKVRIERKPVAITLTTDTLKEIIHGLPTDQFAFDDLRGQVSADYETLKDVVFALLSEAPASIRQVFDTEAKTMRLVRVKR